MEKPKFLPPVKFTPLKFSRSVSAHATISWTSTPVSNVIAIALREAYPQLYEISRFCDFFVLSRPIVVIFSRNGGKLEPLDGF